jgi:G3E family GTPase
MKGYASLIPVNIVTGFLGSGKTTLLRRLLASPQLSDTAVLVNEFGEVGLDHHLIEHVAESTLLLKSGCVCCAIRGDLKDSLRDLFSRRQRGEIPQFRRVVIETSGLADPVPIAYTVLAEPVIQHHFRLGNVVTTVDAVNGARQLDAYPESVKQAAAADRLVLTKTDMADPEQTASLLARLKRLNLSAPVFEAARGDLDPERLLTDDIHDPDGKARDAESWLDAQDGHVDPGHDHVFDHRDDVSSFCLLFDEPLDWTAFGIWMTMLLNRHGEQVLRIKGMLNVAGVDHPVLINGVQHIVHPAAHLEAWPDGDRRSRIVFIVRDIPRARIEASLAAFNALANPGNPGSGQAIAPIGRGAIAATAAAGTN